MLLFIPINLITCNNYINKENCIISNNLERKIGFFTINPTVQLNTHFSIFP